MGNEEIDLEEQVQNKKCGCSHKKKERSKGEAKKLINRLNRIEGQVRGIKRMLEQDAYCTDILIQVSAVNAALNSFNKELLAEHIRTCVAEDIRQGKRIRVQFFYPPTKERAAESRTHLLPEHSA